MYLSGFGETDIFPIDQELRRQGGLNPRPPNSQANTVPTEPRSSKFTNLIMFRLTLEFGVWLM